MTALHLSENGDRPQARTKDGRKKFLLKWPKQTKRPIASPIRGPGTYDEISKRDVKKSTTTIFMCQVSIPAYVQELMEEPSP